MVSHEKFIFVHMVKTGGTFLQHYFGQAIPGCRASGSGHNRHKPVSSVMDAPQFKFGSIRNPYSWYVSWWAFQAVQRRPGNSMPSLLVKSFPQSVKNIDAARGIIKQTKSPLFIDFDIAHRFDIGVMTYKFIETFCHPKIFSRDSFDGFRDGDIIVDRFVSMENLRDDIVSLFRNNIFELSDNQCSLLYSTPDINVSQHGDFGQYYDKETMEWVRHKERHLLKMFPEYNYVGDSGQPH